MVTIHKTRHDSSGKTSCKVVRRSSRRRLSGGRQPYYIVIKPKIILPSPYDPNFQQHSSDSGVYIAGYRDSHGRRPDPPKNLKTVRKRLARSPRSVTPSSLERMFDEFEEADDRVCCEQEVMESIMPLIEGPDKSANRERARGLLFGNLAPLTNAKLCKANPDRYYGSHPDKLDKKVRERLSDKIVPSRRKHLPVLPNFFVEIKGPSGSRIVAKWQECYYGALGARGMHALRTYRARSHQAPAA
jgi:hypothetical protein